MENALAVANFFLKKSFDSGVEVTPMKLVKLVYIAHGWYLGLTGEPLIAEGVQAWRYGPVVQSIYDYFKVYGGQQITELAATLGPNGQMVYYDICSDEVLPLLERVWDVYKDRSGVELSALTHQNNTPWSETWHAKGGKDTKGAVIPNAQIQAHYEELAGAAA